MLALLVVVLALLLWVKGTCPLLLPPPCGWDHPQQQRHAQQQQPRGWS